MMTEDKRTRFPQTNKEYFRLVRVNGLLFSSVVFVFVLVGGRLLAPFHRWHAVDFAKAAAVSLLIGFQLTLIRLRWLKARDK
jgi:hypothetical protein